jgi:superfamily II DNA helicase RecQ
MTQTAVRETPAASITSVLRTYWGFDSLRPPKRRRLTPPSKAATSVVAPTGGGRSLCYQVPRP